jgi:deoxyribonuclease-4
MIRFGPAGIPLSCKGRTLRDGVEDVHNLSLSAMEIQMVRARTISIYPEDEEVGMTLNEIEDKFIIEAYRDGEPIGYDEPLDEEDELVLMLTGVSDCFGELEEVGHLAKRLDVRLSLHTPYYMDLSSDDATSNKCMDSIRYGGLIVNALDGDMVVTNLGVYKDGVPKEDVEGEIVNNLATILDWWDGMGIKPKLGIEVSGNQDVFGTLDQVLGICDEFGPTTVPVLNFPQFHSYTDGALIDSSDFETLIEQVAPYYEDSSIYTAFAGVEYSNGSEKRVTPIKKGDLKFEPLAEALNNLTPNATVISSSPLLEHDAMYMRVINERVLAKRVAKAMREEKKKLETADGEA